MHTIKDVATLAGVSIGTVSNYINKTKPVSESIEKRIKAAIESLEYTPNFFAKSLKSQKHNDVGVVLPNLTDPYFAQIFQGIELAFQNTPYFLNLSFSYDIPEIERNIIANLLGKNICGLILVACQPDNWHFYLDKLKDKPLVLIDRMIKNLDANFISFDNRRTLRTLVSDLISEGKKNLYLFSGPASFYCENECVLGYYDAFHEAGLSLSPNKIFSTVVNKEKAFQQTINVLKSNCPDAILTTSELSALGVIEALVLLGYSKEDVPVITLGAEHWNQYTRSFASVSTVRPSIQMGDRAAKLLMQQLHSPKTFEKSNIILQDRLSDNYDIRQIKNVPPIKMAVQSEINILMLETPQSESFRGLLQNFENTTGIHANIEVLPHTQLFNRILQESKSDRKQSDVYMFDIPWLFDLASRGILLDLTEYIKDPSFDESIFLPNCLKYFSEFDGSYFGLPFMFAPQIFYYRKDLFEQSSLSDEYQRRYHSKLNPPRTWKEFTAIAEFFTSCENPANKVRYGTSIPAAYKECMVPEIYMRLWSYGGRIFDNRFNITIDSPQALKAYINYKSTFKYAKPDYKTATDVSVVSDFINGETAMLITYPSFIANITDLQTISLVGGIGYSHIPGKAQISVGWSFGINAQSKKKDDAFKFLSWTCTEENGNYFTLLGGQPAIDRIFTNDELVKLYPWLPLYRSAYQYTEPVLPPYKPGRLIISQDKIDTVIYKYATDLIDEKIDIASTLRLTQKDLEDLFRQYNYL